MRRFFTGAPLGPVVLAAAAVASLAFAAPAVQAAPITIKLASLAPDGSIWDQAVEEMGNDWKQATSGRVALRIYPGGVAGDEPDVVRKMRIGQLHAAVLTHSGLGDLDPAFEVFSIPFLFDSYEELYHVCHALEPMLAKRLEAKGYVLLHWGHAGWLHLFSREEVRTLDAMRSVKFFVPAGDEELVQGWKENGFLPVPLASTDIMTGLQTGLIGALPSPPLAALLLQWYRQAPHMLDVPFAPLVGATVVSKRIWDRLSPEDQATLRASAAKIEEHLEAEVPRQDEKSIEAMQERGLEVTAVVGTPDEKPWRDAAAVFAERVREGDLPPEVLEAALEARAEFRAGSAAGGQP